MVGYWDDLGFLGLGLDLRVISLVDFNYFTVWILPVNRIPLRGNLLVLHLVCWAF
jgi:hypothetical protein